LLILVLSCLCYTLAVALPTQNGDAAASAELPPQRFASDASQKIALNMLKFNVDIDSNQVYSPLGISSILAVLAEGAAGETYEEFSKTLGFPAERADLRASFQRILSRYQNKEYSTAPSFQTWLYIYRNNTARDEFKQLVRDNYFVMVKDINSDEYDWNEPNTSLDVETSSVSNSKDVVGFETLKRLRADANLAAAATETQSADTYGEEVIDKEASKFDRVVDDKQYVEKPAILEEIKKQQTEKQEDEKVDAEPLKAAEGSESAATIDEVSEQLKETEAADIAEIPKHEDELIAKDISKREEDVNFEDNETVHSGEKLQKLYGDDSDGVIPIQEVLDSNEPEKVSLPLQKLESALDTANKNAGEIMIALESHISSVRRALGARSLFRKEDIAHALSANSITGREAASKTKMLLFNGLYFAGLWAQPFTKLSSEDESFFFMTAEDAMKVPMMETMGTFHVAELKNLNAKVICLPYENKKYAMMIVLPNETEGLRSLIEKLQPEDFKKAKSQVQKKELRLIMPKFQVDETSRSEAMLKSIGLTKLFAREDSDLSLLSADIDLHVDEVVQFVSVRVDESGSSENGLTASDTQARTAAAPEIDSIEVNRPFLYFVMDCEEEFVLAAGKIYTPELKEDPPISIEVEFEQ
ncbi:serine protease inhibitor 88Ea, partial [Bactrocera tryoni]|uniref:serine protease inhibitor 88Ea n=1 Tax=Bactrocera tryoni TaxID=59916 RepID=UPI001A966810